MKNTEFATKKDLKSFESKIDQQFKQQTVEITPLIKELIDEIGPIKQGIVDLKKSHDRLLKPLDNHYQTIKGIQIENHARDAEFARLKAWAVHTAKETGVKLGY